MLKNNSKKTTVSEIKEYNFYKLKKKTRKSSKEKLKICSI
jgi:hypothetical protein